MMDILKDYAVQAYQLYNAADPYLQPIRSMYFEAQAQLYPIVLPLLHKAAIFTQDSPVIISVGVIILFLLITMQILNFVRRVMMWWTRFLMSLMFWGLIILVIAVVAQRGVGRTVGDLYEWGVELSEVWWREYRRWEGYQNQAQYKGQIQGQGGPKPGVRAGSSWR